MRRLGYDINTLVQGTCTSSCTTVEAIQRHVLVVLFTFLVNYWFGFEVLIEFSNP
jgi:hypothetical protein